VADGLGVSLADLASSRGEIDGVISRLGGNGVALGLSVDVTDAESVEAAVAAHIKHFGGLDVMVANAGIDRGPWRNVVFMIKQAADSDLGECQ
jgi:meso-butanediol dehydrogenase/(S,S)-butanediol dehydrogenase/diacetyl reductase